MTRASIIIILFSYIIAGKLYAQPQETAPGTYIVFLKDKKNNDFRLDRPETFLSQRAIDHRKRQSISIDSSDLPVSSFYLDSLRKLGFIIHNTSRWFNSVTVKTDNPELAAKAETVRFIESLEKPLRLRLELHSTSHVQYSTFAIDSTSYGPAYRQIHVHNGEYLHASGFKGEGMLIAIIDAGFYHYKSMSGFNHVVAENRIEAVRDFVNHDGDVNDDHYHGTNVFSIIGGKVENSFEGTAPNASFLLLRSEDATTDSWGVQNEYLVEEDNWIAAAEFADSMGTDVINSSLGYSTFTNPDQNHTYEDMNGSATRISRAATMATKKGMIVVVSAGNHGNKAWKYIEAPADAENVLAVGAVDSKLVRASFSSIGPTADNRIKPDVMAIGQRTFYLSTDDVVAFGNGTSYATPVIAGLTACLWQAAPGKRNTDVIRAILKSSDLYSQPNNNYGYGLPDFRKALQLLSLNAGRKGLLVYPNPFSLRLTLLYKPLKGETLTVEFFNTTGKRIYMKLFSIEPGVGGEIEVDDFSDIPPGVVFIRAISGDDVMSATAIKL
jgi:subtilisin family serine protease